MRWFLCFLIIIFGCALTRADAIPNASVILNVIATQSLANPDRGIARYTYEHASELLMIAPHSIAFCDFDHKLPLSRMHMFCNLRSEIRQSVAKPPVNVGSLQIYHVMSPFEEPLTASTMDSLWPLWARTDDMRLVVTVFDLIPLVYTQVYLANPTIRDGYMQRIELIKKADAILTISQSAADDVARLLSVDPNRIFVIGTGVSPKFVRPPHRLPLPTGIPGLKREYVFYTGGVDYRKNIEGLLSGYGLLPKATRAQIQLVITCKMSQDAQNYYWNYARTQHLDLTPDEVIFTGYVSDETLQQLYGAARMFVFPSLMEGFGLPIVEAIRSGVLPIVSGQSAMADIIPLKQLWFDPTSPKTIANKILEVLRMPDSTYKSLVDQLYQHSLQYNWETVTKRSLSAYEAVLKLPKISPTASHQHRLAIFTPMPPQQSGISDYSVRMIDTIAKRGVMVDVFVDVDPKQLTPMQNPLVRLIHHQQFRALHTATPYKNIIYCMGNSQFHVYMLSYMRTYRGDVIAHDMRFTGLYWTESIQKHPDAQKAFHQYVNALDGSMMLPVALPDSQALDPNGAAMQKNFYMASEIMQATNRVFVMSSYAAKLARFFGASNVNIIPFGYPMINQPYPPNTPEFWICTFGMWNPLKSIDLIIEAVGLLAPAHPAIRFAVVGSIPQHIQASYQQLIAQYPALSGKVVFTGHVTEDEYRTWLQRTSLAIQIRHDSCGEMSAAVADCFAAGIPTILQEVGPLGEFQDISLHIGQDATTDSIVKTIQYAMDHPKELQELGAKAKIFAHQVTFENIAEQLSNTFLFNDFEYLGCYVDVPGRLVKNRHMLAMRLGKISVQDCANLAKEHGYSHFALQALSECRGVSYLDIAQSHGPSEHCKKCIGQPEEKNLMCGGDWANSIYRLL